MEQLISTRSLSRSTHGCAWPHLVPSKARLQCSRTSNRLNGGNVWLISSKSYRPGLVAYSVRIVRNQPDGEEAVQTAFEKCLEKPPRVASDAVIPEAIIRGWLHTVVYRESINWHPKAPIRFGYLVVPNNRFGNLPTRSMWQLTRSWRHAELEEHLHEEMELLSKREREILGMKLYEGLTFSSIGHALGISEQYAGQIYRKALRKLRYRLK